MTGPVKNYVALVGLLTVAACGGSGSATGAAQPQTTQAAGTGQRQGPPSTSGLLAALAGNTLQVQTGSAQVAVTYGAGTTFTDTVKASVADVTVGSCVIVRSTGTSTGSTPATSVPSAVTATSVTVTAPVSGSCTGGFTGAGAGGGFRGMRPSGAPDGGVGPSGAPGARRFGGGEFGKVTSTSATGFVLLSSRPGTGGTTASPTSSPVTVSVNAATTYAASKKATAAALKVGECVTARGTADSVGTVAATAISIRPATGGGCTNLGGPGA